jgi:hypothetical protein
MRVMTACLVLLATMSLAITSPASALFDVGFMGGPVNTGIPFVVGPCFTAAAPFSQGTAFMIATNTSTLAHDFTGSLAIAFGPGTGQFASGAFGFPLSPVIAQTTSETVAATRSYYFADFLAGV